MRQTPFGVWNLRQANVVLFVRRQASMRQTPFGVWNPLRRSNQNMDYDASMRQTPFGVWNMTMNENVPSGCSRFNEADAFRRLE